MARVRGVLGLEGSFAGVCGAVEYGVERGFLCMMLPSEPKTGFGRHRCACKSMVSPILVGLLGCALTAVLHLSLPNFPSNMWDGGGIFAGGRPLTATCGRSRGHDAKWAKP